jgi:hypothetical protein
MVGVAACGTVVRFAVLVEKVVAAFNCVLVNVDDNNATTTAIRIVNPKLRIFI